MTSLRRTIQTAPQEPDAGTLPKLPLVVLLYLLSVTVPIGFYAGPLYMTTLRLLLLLVTLPLLVRLLMGKYGRTLPTDWLFLGHAIWLALALLRNNPEQAIQQAPSVGVEFLGGYVIARAYVRDPAIFLAVCKWAVLLVLVTLPFALMETVTGDPPIIRILQAVPGLKTVEILTIEARLGLERVQANFAHPIHYGLFASIAFSMAYVALEGVFTQKRRVLSAGVVAFCGFLALSSGALLAILLQMALIGWAALFRKLDARWWLLVGLFALAYVAIDVMSDRTPLRVFMSYATFSAHNAFWRGIIFEWGLMNVFGSAEQKIPASPWFGIGLNDWVRPHFMPSSSMDNFWLVMAVRYGVPGFLLITAGWLLGLGAIMARGFGEHSRVGRIRRAYVFTFIGLTLTLCTVHVWTNIFSFVFFMFGAGLWMIRFDPATETSPDTVPGPVHPRRGPPVRPAAEQPVFSRFAPGERPATGSRRPARP